MNGSKLACTIAIIATVVLVASCQSGRYIPSLGVPGQVRQVIVTCDDYGSSEMVDQAIYQAIEQGVPLTVSSHVTFARSADAITRLHTDHPQIPIGLHLSVTSGSPVSTQWAQSPFVDEQGQFLTIDQIIPVVADIPPELWRAEITAQIARIVECTGTIDHISSQDNIALMYTPALEVLSQIAREHEIPLRSPLPVSQSILTEYEFPIEEVAMGYVRSAAKNAPIRVAALRRYTTLASMMNNVEILKENGIPHPTYAAGGLYFSADLATIEAIIAAIPPGESAEIVFHLGLPDNDSPVPHGINAQYYHQRYRESELLREHMSEIQQILDRYEVKLIGFQDLTLQSLVSQP
jgi:predicted glycoside hydrolase/deacetylase ChbG (UPF0249 family)